MLERNKNIDLLRVIACVMVVVLHVSASYVIQNIKNPNICFTIGNLIDSFMRVSVPIFVLISGAFNLSNSKNIEYGYFYKKTFKNIILPTIVWGAIYCSYSLILDIVKGNNLTIFSFLRTYSRVIRGTAYYHLWYMYMLIGLYAVTPIIYRSIKEIKLKQLFFISFFFIGLGVINTLFSKMIWPLSFVNYIGYYILGYCLKQYYSQDNKGKQFILIYIIGSLITFFLTEVMIRFNLLNKTLYFYENLSPFVIVSSIGIFIYFLRHKEFSIKVDRILPHTFNIYLIHAGIYNVISMLINKLDRWGNPILFIPFLSIIVFLISWGLSTLINKGVKSLKKYYTKNLNRLVVIE